MLEPFGFVRVTSTDTACNHCRITEVLWQCGVHEILAVARYYNNQVLFSLINQTCMLLKISNINNIKF